MGDPEGTELQSAVDLLIALFAKELADPERYDQEVVALVKHHLSQQTIHSQAGARLANAMIDLAKRRANEASI